MEAEFWLERWRDGRTHFHQSRVTPLLQKYWPSLALPAGSTVLVPLCGKSLDMLWLAEQRHRVLGVELSELAFTQFFSEHRFEPHITMEMSSNETIKQAVMAGMGLSFLSLHTLGLELRSRLLRVLDIDGTPVMRTWYVVRLQSQVLSPAAEAFRYFILERGEPHLRAHDAGLQVRLAALEDEVAEGLGRRREHLRLQAHHVPRAHHRRAVDV